MFTPPQSRPAPLLVSTAPKSTTAAAHFNEVSQRVNKFLHTRPVKCWDLPTGQPTVEDLERHMEKVGALPDAQVTSAFLHTLLVDVGFGDEATFLVNRFFHNYRLHHLDNARLSDFVAELTCSRVYEILRYLQPRTNQALRPDDTELTQTLAEDLLAPRASSSSSSVHPAALQGLISKNELYKLLSYRIGAIHAKKMVKECLMYIYKVQKVMSSQTLLDSLRPVETSIWSSHGPALAPAPVTEASGTGRHGLVNGNRNGTGRRLGGGETPSNAHTHESRAYPLKFDLEAWLSLADVCRWYFEQEVAVQKRRSRFVKVLTGWHRFISEPLRGGDLIRVNYVHPATGMVLDKGLFPTPLYVVTKAVIRFEPDGTLSGAVVYAKTGASGNITLADGKQALSSEKGGKEVHEKLKNGFWEVASRRRSALCGFHVLGQTFSGHVVLSNMRSYYCDIVAESSKADLHLTVGGTTLFSDPFVNMETEASTVYEGEIRAETAKADAKRDTLTLSKRASAAGTPQRGLTGTGSASVTARATSSGRYKNTISRPSMSAFGGSISGQLDNKSHALWDAVERFEDDDWGGDEEGDDDSGAEYENAVGAPVDEEDEDEDEEEDADANENESDEANGGYFGRGNAKEHGRRGGNKENWNTKKSGSGHGSQRGPLPASKATASTFLPRSPKKQLTSIPATPALDEFGGKRLLIRSAVRFGAVPVHSMSSLNDTERQMLAGEDPGIRAVSVDLQVQRELRFAKGKGIKARKSTWPVMAKTVPLSPTKRNLTLSAAEEKFTSSFALPLAALSKSKHLDDWNAPKSSTSRMLPPPFSYLTASAGLAPDHPPGSASARVPWKGSRMGSRAGQATIQEQALQKLAKSVAVTPLSTQREMETRVNTARSSVSTFSSASGTRETNFVHTLPLRMQTLRQGIVSITRQVKAEQPKMSQLGSVSTQAAATLARPVEAKHSSLDDVDEGSSVGAPASRNPYEGGDGGDGERNAQEQLVDPQWVGPLWEAFPILENIFRSVAKSDPGVLGAVGKRGSTVNLPEFQRFLTASKLKYLLQLSKNDIMAAFQHANRSVFSRHDRDLHEMTLEEFSQAFLDLAHKGGVVKTSTAPSSSRVNGEIVNDLASLIQAVQNNLSGVEARKTFTYLHQHQGRLSVNSQ